MGVSRRLTVKREIDKVKKQIQSRGVEWTKARDITLLKLSKRYGPRQYNAIAWEMKLDWEAVKNRLRKLLAKIRIKKEAKLNNAGKEYKSKGGYSAYDKSTKDALTNDGNSVFNEVNALQDHIDFNLMDMTMGTIQEQTSVQDSSFQDQATIDFYGY